ncbi:MAG: tetratricopeptide repeat protein [Gammaproteobacteria bacterium]|nr:tetratricopeptide repeat protein [Gammaproteobacteria bacterium]
MARRRKPQKKRRGGGQARKPATAASRRPPAHEQSWFPWVLLAFISLLAYANALHNVLALDDGAFLGGDRFDGLGPADFIRFFSQSLLEASANASSLYRPMLLVSVGSDNLLFGDWYVGFHLANVLRHTLAVLLVFGFLRQLLLATGFVQARAQLVAMAAALVFAVHPVLSDAVNSVYNGSGIYVAIFVVGGLWYLLAHHRERPVKSWLVASACYFIALMYKESAVSMPALAVIVLWLATSDPWESRLKSILPVFFLLLPLAAYLGMRAQALEDFDNLAAQFSLVSSAYAVESNVSETVAAQARPAPALREFGLTFDPARAAIAVSMWFDGLRLMVWPHPLTTLRETSQTSLWLAVGAQLGLLALCLFAFFRKRPLALLGVLFFYVAILPASRIVGEGALQPQLMDRMLYLPSVGLAICLAALLDWLVRRFRLRVGVAVAAALILAFIPVTWARNADWSDEIRLLEHDFAVTGQNGQLMYALIRAYTEKGQAKKSLNLCRDRADLAWEHQVVANECGETYRRAGRYDAAETLFLQSLERSPGYSRSHFHLARLYVQMDRWRDARDQFKQAIELERVPYLREYMRGVMLLDLYPHDRERLEEARGHMESALRIQPRALEVRTALEYLDSLL